MCAPAQVQRYLGRISGPLMDRIDLHIEVAPVPFEELRRREPGEASEAVRARVVAARRRQAERLGDAASEPGASPQNARRRRSAHCNAQMTTRQVRRHCALDAAGEGLMKMALSRLGLSARAYDRILKVARTVADLDGAARIGTPHLSEAIQYRSLDRNAWTR